MKYSIIQKPHGFNKGANLDICPSITKSTWECNNFVKEGNQDTMSENVTYRIRKLTPIECWKLMGWDKSDIEKAKSVEVADSHLYKQAGNGIVTNCVQLLMEHLYKAQYDNSYKCADENFTQPQQV